jgi:hypothetical protein
LVSVIGFVDLPVPTLSTTTTVYQRLPATHPSCTIDKTPLLSSQTMTNLVLQPFQAATFTQVPCLGEHFYGNYGGNKPISLFIAPEACTSQLNSLTSEPILATALENPSPSKQLVWIEEVAIDDNLRLETFNTSLDGLLERITQGHATSTDQEVLNAATGVHPVMYQGASSALVFVDSEVARSMDTLLPPYLKSSLIPPSPTTYIPVPSDAVKRVQDLLQTMRFEADVASLVNSISLSQMRQDVRYLTGEDGSGLVSRHSFSPGARKAAKWLKETFESTGASCELKPFAIGFSPNVVCTYPSIVDTTATVIISGHYDSRGTFGSTRAPGGNDDGSGTTALLAIARAIAKRGVQFHSNVQLVAFAGEEQGLVGSRAYARQLRQLDANITLMIQADMLAYHSPDEPAQLGLPDIIGTPEVAQLVANASSIYSPELMIGVTPACCSDHQSFHEQGFPATQVYERAGPILDPMYHNSGDLSDREGYDLKQVRSIAKVQFATLLHAAGFSVPSKGD